MFGNFKEEREKWNKYFDFFVKKFNEEVGICPAVYESNEYEVDINVGDQSGKVLGIRAYRYIPIQEDTNENQGKENNKYQSDDEDDEEETEYEVFQIDFIRSDDSEQCNEVENAGKVFLEFRFKNPMKDDDKYSIFKFYMNEKEEILGAVEINERDGEKKTFYEPILIEDS